MKNKAVIFLIVLFWVVSMSWLVRYEAFPQWFNAEPSQGYGALFRDGLYLMDSWMQIYFKDAPVGFSHTWVDNEPGNREESFFIKNQTSIDIKIMGQDYRVHILSTIVLNDEYKLRGFDFKMRANRYETEVTGSHVSGSVYNIKIKTAGGEQGLRINIPEDVVVYSPATEMTVSRLNPGQTMTLQTFDPVSMSTVDCVAEGVRREKILFLDEYIDSVVVKLTAHGFETIAWIDDNGRVIRQETPFGWTMEATTAARIKMTSSSDDAQDFLLGSSVPCEGVVAKPRTCSSLVLELKGPGIAGLMRETQRQLFTIIDEETVHLTLLRGKNANTVKFSTADADADMREFLEPSVYIQSDHPDLQRLAADITADSGDMSESAVRINDWVFKNISKGSALSVPSAIAVLKAREGDCNEHAYLFAALARAAGIPTKLNIGLVYENNRFFYHTWVSVFLGEWIEMDPMLGQTAVDATHIILAEGELKNQRQIMAVMGRLKARVITEL